MIAQPFAACASGGLRSPQPPSQARSATCWRVQRHHPGRRRLLGGSWQDILKNAAKAKGWALTYIVSDKSKNDLFTDFLPLVNSQLVALLDPKTGVVPHRAVKQLLSLERRISNQGKDTIEQPRGGVIDVINAVAGACLARRPA